MRYIDNLPTFIPLTYDCNNNCISCPVPRKGVRKNFSLDYIKNKIDQIALHSKHIELNGGEPCLNKDLFNILNYTYSKGFQEITLLSNIEMFSYELYSKKISKFKNLKLITTLYGSNLKIHDAITRTPGSFKRKIKGLKNLIKFKVKIELRILIHKMNYFYFNDIVDFLINNFKSDDFIKIVIMNPRLTGAALKNRKNVAIRLNVISKLLQKPILKLIKNKFNVELYHFPNCVLPLSTRKLSKGLTSPLSEVCFIERCNQCIDKKKCSGIWKSYFNIYGSKEFQPIK
jgi:MoaA/NifB/PqqE/SkfB family radical SAM enzyme